MDASSVRVKPRAVFDETFLVRVLVSPRTPVVMSPGAYAARLTMNVSSMTA